MNREWHEFSHYAMWSEFGELPPMHQQVTTTGSSEWIDENHAGFENHCSSDSWTEGYAEFMPMLINEYYNQRPPGVIYFGTSASSKYFYPVAESTVKYELNHIRDKDEEYAIASILFDLWDGKSSLDKDNIQIEEEELLNLLLSSIPHPTYYTYNEQTGKTELNTDPDSEYRKIYYITDLYDHLILYANTFGEFTEADVDQLFISHGFYNDENGNNKHDTGEEIGAWNKDNPDRRQYDIPLESSIIIKTNRDANLTVQVDFTEPYTDYSYAYTIPVALGEQQIGLLAPPETYNASITFTLTSGADTAEETYTLENTDYWINRETGNGIGELTYTYGGSTGGVWGLGVLAVKIIAVILGVLIVLGFLRERNIL